MIDSFRGQYEFFSNFSASDVIWLGLHYPTVENAYQSAKSVGGTKTAYITCTPLQSKKLGQACELREDWDDVKIDVMENLLRQKFKAGTVLAEYLIDTGEEELVEGNTWNDTFWGVCKGKGENHLGKLLMQIRKEIQ